MNEPRQYSFLLTGATTDQLDQLNGLCVAIKDENVKAIRTGKKMIDHLVNCGEMLIKLKGSLPHGEFASALKQIKIKPRTATTYMKIAANRHRVADSAHGVRDALRLIDEAKGAIKNLPAPEPEQSRVVDAEIVETKDGTKIEDEEVPEPEAEVEVEVVVDPEDKPATASAEPVVDDPRRAKRLARKTGSFVMDDADRLYALAHGYMEKILSNDKSREKVLKEMIAYCEDRLEASEPEPYDTVLETLPKLTDDQRTQLGRILVTRWNIKIEGVAR